MVPHIQRLARLCLLAFLMMALPATYWALTGYESILRRSDNARLFEAQARIWRGALYDRHQELLVHSQVQANGTVQRQTLHEAFYGALGYYSLRYGVAGAEARYDSLLTGATTAEDFANRFERDILHRPQRGADLRLSLDAILQTQAYQALQGRRGAIVLLAVPSGEILASVSLPTYNPNSLDADWESLKEAEGKPFFNRVTQGSYQAGSSLQTLLMMAALLSATEIDQAYPDADQSILLNDLRLTCAFPPPSTSLSLRQAFAYACPAPFIAWLNQAELPSLPALLQSLALDQAPPIDALQAAPEATPEATANSNTPQDFMATALGQGDSTLNVLAFATYISAIVNQGNGVTPRLHLATRPPEQAWQAVAAPYTQRPIMTQAVAQALKQVMIEALAVHQPTLTSTHSANEQQIGGHSGVAYSGQQALSWFAGFASLPNGTSLVIVSLIEAESDARIAQTFSLTLLEQALQRQASGG